MIDDCLKTEIRLLGIIQPLTRIKKDLNSYQNIVGCYGKIIRFEETEKKTYLISLKGLSRFRIKTSYLTKQGYIKSQISELEFNKDKCNIDMDEFFKYSNSNALKTVLKSYLRKKKLESNWDYINATSNLDLVNQLSMICPFSIKENQMLLESNTINDRYILLISILKMQQFQMKKNHHLNTNYNQNIDKLLKILICPKTGSSLEYDKEKQELMILKQNWHIQ